jgi:hypothetical protein
MTGKFHTSWGDFHSFKNQAALRFECMRMLSMNAQCSIGDQLHPNGKICQYTYDLIGSVYEEVAEKESWCEEATARVDIGVFTVEEFTHERTPMSTAGALRLLTEGQHQYDVIDSQSDLSPYRVLILPDEIVVDQALADKLAKYVNAGGALICSYKSGLSFEGNYMLGGLTGVDLLGEADYSPDFLVPQGEIGEGLPPTEHVMYLRGMKMATIDAEVLAETRIPYFNRTWEHFCSHRHTPSAGETGPSGIIRKGNVITFAHPIFQQYEQNAPRWVKQLFLNAVKMLIPDPVLQVDGPSTLIATVNRQTQHHRDIVHLLHFIPERRGRDFDVVEDVITLTRIPVRLKVDQPVEMVRVVPEGEVLPFDIIEGYCHVMYPVLSGHGMLEVQYKKDDK